MARYKHLRTKAQLRSFRQLGRDRADWPGRAWPGYGYLYVIALFEDGPCKIGISVQPKNRIQGLEAAAGVRYPHVFISRECSDYREVEQEILQRLQSVRTVGEWYNMPFAWGIEAIDKMKPKYLSAQKIGKMLQAASERVQPISESDPRAS